MSQLAMAGVTCPRPLWESFALALGPQEMSACYGWDAVPADARWGETVYKFHRADAHGVIIGWSSLAKYPKEPDVFELALGIWPAYQRNGYRHSILDLTATVAFTEHGAEHVVMLVLDSATVHARVCLAEAEAGSPWVYSGRVWHGDPLRSFTLTREAWESSKRKI
jgi:hypothetical protein